MVSFGMFMATSSGCSSSTQSGLADAGTGTADGGDAGAQEASTPSDPTAAYDEIPVSGGADAPTLATISLKCVNSRADLAENPEPGAAYPGAFVRMGVVSDPRGFSNLDGISQGFALFDGLTAGKSETHTFQVDAAASGTVFFDPGDYFRGYFEGPSGAAATAEFCAKG